MQRLTNAATNLQIVLLLTMLLAICSFVVMVSP